MGFLSKTSRCVLGFVLFGLPAVSAKTSSGDFQLSNKKTEHVITSFSIAAGASGIMTAVLLSKDQYENEQNLKMHLYRDDDWVKVHKAKTCQEKTAHARQTVQVQFELENAEQIRQWGYTKPRWRSETHLKIEPVESEEKDYAPRHHYWYVVFDDCSFEGHSRDPTKTPKVNFYIQIYNMLSENAYTHLSTDEFGLTRIHTLTMFVSGIACFLLFGKISYNLTTSGIVHIAKVMVMGAAAFDTLSSAFELLHMNFYRLDGMGWYLLDSYAAYNEALCDAMICFLLLAIAAGWTLPSDVISIKHGQDNATMIQNILAGLANPTGAKSWKNPFTGLLFGLTGVHLMLAHWGLSYNDEYDSYHDLEHMPGKILMALRFGMGVFMLAAVTQTRIKCRASLHSFYTSFAIVGMLWFQGLPAITWFCNSFVAFHQRHPTVIMAGAILQSTSLLLLSWLVAMDGSAYHKVSHITQSGDNDLTEKMASVDGSSNALTWKLFGKTKLRLD